jgi:Zn-finger protein
MLSKNNGENIWNCLKNFVSLHRKSDGRYVCLKAMAVIVNGIRKSGWKIFYS